MPNHVINKVEFDCPQDRLQEILAAICYDENSDVAEMTGPGTIDFNKITPMPPSLDIESGSRTIEGINLYLTSINPAVSHFGEQKMQEEAFRALLKELGKPYMFSDVKPNLSQEEIDKYIKYTSAEELLQMGKTAVENRLQYGATTWYDWRIRSDTWNTKWNSYYPEAYCGGDEIVFQTAWDAPHPIIEKLSRMYPEVTIRHQWANEDYSQQCGSRTYRNGEIIDFDIPHGNVETIRTAAEIWGCDLEESGMILNADGSDYINAEYPSFKVMEINDHVVLYSADHLTLQDTPQGMHLYRLQKDLSGDLFYSMDAVASGGNNGGCIISKTPFDLGSAGVLKFTGENQPVLSEEEMNFREYQKLIQENREAICLS